MSNVMKFRRKIGISVVSVMAMSLLAVGSAFADTEREDHPMMTNFEVQTSVQTPVNYDLDNDMLRYNEH